MFRVRQAHDPSDVQATRGIGWGSPLWPKAEIQKRHRAGKQSRTALERPPPGAVWPPGTGDGTGAHFSPTGTRALAGVPGGFPPRTVPSLQPDRRQGAAHETFFPRTLNAVVICHNPIIFLRSLSAAADRLPLSRTGSSGRHVESLHESGRGKKLADAGLSPPLPAQLFPAIGR